MTIALLVLNACLASAVFCAAPACSLVDGRLVARGQAERLAKKELVATAVASVLLCLGCALLQKLGYGRETSAVLQWQTALALAASVAAIDAKHRVVPNKAVLAGLAWAVALLVGVAVLDPDRARTVALGVVAGAALGASVFLVARLLSRGGVGWGDIKLYAVLGLLVGFSGMLNVLLLSMAAAFLYSVFLLARKKKHMNDRLPLAPFACAGVVLSIVLGA